MYSTVLAQLQCSTEQLVQVCVQIRHIFMHACTHVHKTTHVLAGTRWIGAWRSAAVSTEWRVPRWVRRKGVRQGGDDRNRKGRWGFEWCGGCRWCRVGGWWCKMSSGVCAQCTSQQLLQSVDTLPIFQLWLILCLHARAHVCRDPILDFCAFLLCNL